MMGLPRYDITATMFSSASHVPLNSALALNPGAAIFDLRR